MTKQKSLYTVKQAVAMAFNNMPETFDGISLITMTRAILARPACFDGTVLRRLREIRDENPKKYNYRVIDHDLSKYKKITA